MAIRFESTRIRSMGRQSRGVRGIETRRDGGQNDQVVSMAVIPSSTEETLLTVCENGYGKRSHEGEYRVQNRGGMGLITIKVNERNGNVVNLRPVAEDDHLMLITSGGKIIRMVVSAISVLGRNTMGVRLIRMVEGEKVVGVERLADRESASVDIADPVPPSIIPPPPDDDPPEDDGGDDKTNDTDDKTDA
jgi:DNA gyrase subunit A